MHSFSTSNCKNDLPQKFLRTWQKVPVPGLQANESVESEPLRVGSRESAL